MTTLRSSDGLREWPDAFVYVCSASKAAVVNIAPIVHAGASRVKAAVVFCGAPEHSNKREDRREALEPMEQLRTWLTERQIPVTVVHGHSDDPGPWARAARACAEDARNKGLPVVFNAAGGRACMKLGALWPPMPDMMTLVTEGALLTSGFIETVGDLPTYRRAARNGSLSLFDYLYCYKVIEAGQEARIARQTFYRDHSDAIAAFGAALIAGRHANLAPILNRKVQALFDADAFRPGVFSLDRHSPAMAALRHLANLPGLAIAEGAGDDDRVTLNDANTAKLLRGGWLEGTVFNRLRAFAADKPGASVAANVRCHDLISHADREDWGEADAALMINDQLHVVEAKAAIFRDARGATPETRAARRKALDQANLFRNRLLGQFGKMWVVNPLAQTRDVTPGYRARLEKVGHLLRGPGAVDTLIDEVRKLSAVGP